MEEKKKVKLKLNIQKFKKSILTIIKLILFITAIILSYIVSDKLIEYLVDIDIYVLKRFFNIILVISIVYLGSYKRDRKEEK